MKQRLVVPTGNTTLLPTHCGYRFVGNGCVRMADLMHIRHYRRHHSRKKITQQSADSTDPEPFQRAVMAPVRAEVCRRMKQSRVVGDSYFCGGAET